MKLDIRNYEYFTGKNEVSQGDEEFFNDNGMWVETGWLVYDTLSEWEIYRRPKPHQALQGDVVLVSYDEDLPIEEWVQRIYHAKNGDKHECLTRGSEEYFKKGIRYSIDSWTHCKPLSALEEEKKTLTKTKRLAMIKMLADKGDIEEIRKVIEG